MDLVVGIYKKIKDGCFINDLRDIPNKFVGFDKCIETQSQGDKHIKELLRKVDKFAERERRVFGRMMLGRQIVWMILDHWKQDNRNQSVHDWEKMEELVLTDGKEMEVLDRFARWADECQNEGLQSEETLN